MTHQNSEDELFRLASLIGCEPHDKERHRIALRRYVEREKLRARIDEIDRLGNYKEQFENRWDLLDAARDRIAELEQELATLTDRTEE